MRNRWEYGTCKDMPARRHCRKGNVQFVLHKAGRAGHKEDYWHNFDSYWWPQFKKINPMKTYRCKNSITQTNGFEAFTRGELYPSTTFLGDSDGSIVLIDNEGFEHGMSRQFLNDHFDEVVDTPVYEKPVFTKGCAIVIAVAITIWLFLWWALTWRS